MTDTNEIKRLNKEWIEDEIKKYEAKGETDLVEKIREIAETHDWNYQATFVALVNVLEEERTALESERANRNHFQNEQTAKIQNDNDEER